METFDEDQMAKEALQEYLMYHPSYYLELNDWQRKILGLGPRKDRKYSSKNRCRGEWDKNEWR